MANLRQMSRVLYRHDWRTVEEWATAVDCLADLSEQEIGEIVDNAPTSWTDGGPCLLAPPGASGVIR